MFSMPASDEWQSRYDLQWVLCADCHVGRLESMAEGLECVHGHMEA